MAKTIALVDFSGYVLSCWAPAQQAQLADPALYNAEEVLPVNLEGKLRTISRDFMEVGIEDFHFVFVEDRKSKRKLEAFPAYKANRPPKEGPNPFPIARRWLKANGYTTFVHSPDNEADDAIAALCARATTPVVIVSSDKDLWQLWNPPQVCIYRMSTQTFVSKEDLIKYFDVDDPKHIPLCKALWGDSGDNIPNAVPRMQKQLLPYIRQTNGKLCNLQGLLEQNRTNLTKRCHELLDQGWKQVMTNFDLVKLDDQCSLVWGYKPRKEDTECNVTSSDSTSATTGNTSP